MLKETARSLRAYFVLVAVFCLLGCVGIMVRGSENPLVLAMGLITFGFGVVDGYIAYRMEHLLLHNPHFIKGVLSAGAAYGSLISLLGLLSGQVVGPFIRLILMALIYLYLTKQVTRLAAEVNLEPSALVVATPKPQGLTH
jgi:hypothetical protein